MPSKFYGIAAAARPTILIGDPSSELAGMLEVHECGVVVAPGDSRRLAEAVELLAGDRLVGARLGANALQASNNHYSRRMAHGHWAALIARVGCESAAAGTNR